ncbi:hypothetical protein BDZ85DRAFT_120517 [Elsinoe ampelina]|uniref:Uncharacterized protein n=1 Tax=Elsinoe ampelina TaxID=302913 RepID=A0A6A6GBH6_9PEZI|nr:hypothetical protein BDZ85DRAFT_120517 [Elsinoe ampelina]
MRPPLPLLDLASSIDAIGNRKRDPQSPLASLGSLPLTPLASLFPLGADSEPLPLTSPACLLLPGACFDSQPLTSPGCLADSTSESV